MKASKVYEILRDRGYNAIGAKKSAEALAYLERKGYSWRWAPEDLSLRDVYPDETDAYIEQLACKLECFELYHECVVLLSPHGEVVEALGSIFYSDEEEKIDVQAELADNFLFAKERELGFSLLDAERIANEYEKAR